VTGSEPIVAKKKPSRADITALIPPSNDARNEIAMTIKANISEGPNITATSASTGVKNKVIRPPTKPPKNA
jgi:hypothetical protein